MAAYPALRHASQAGFGLAAVGEGACIILEPCGGVEGTGAAIFGGLFVVSQGVIDLSRHFAKGGSNTKENAQFAEAVRRIEASIGQKLTPGQIRRLHDEIMGQGYSLDEIVEIGVGMFGA